MVWIQGQLKEVSHDLHLLMKTFQNRPHPLKTTVLGSSVLEFFGLNVAYVVGYGHMNLRTVAVHRARVDHIALYKAYDSSEKIIY